MVDAHAARFGVKKITRLAGFLPKAAVFLWPILQLQADRSFAPTVGSPAHA
jgi:hypothetical protein